MLAELNYRKSQLTMTWSKARVNAGTLSPALRVCTSYGIRAEWGNDTATVEEKDRPAWILLTYTSSTPELALWRQTCSASKRSVWHTWDVNPDHSMAYVCSIYHA